MQEQAFNTKPDGVCDKCFLSFMLNYNYLAIVSEAQTAVET